VYLDMSWLLMQLCANKLASGVVYHSLSTKMN
jgi:hypothetical protein